MNKGSGGFKGFMGVNPLRGLFDGQQRFQDNLNIIMAAQRTELDLRFGTVKTMLGSYAELDGYSGAMPEGMEDVRGNLSDHVAEGIESVVFSVSEMRDFISKSPALSAETAQRIRNHCDYMDGFMQDVRGIQSQFHPDSGDAPYGGTRAYPPESRRIDSLAESYREVRTQFDEKLFSRVAPDQREAFDAAQPMKRSERPGVVEYKQKFGPDSGVPAQSLIIEGVAVHV